MSRTTYSIHPFRPGTLVQRPPLPRNEYEQYLPPDHPDNTDTTDELLPEEET